MKGLDAHENIDVSDTKLMLGLRVCFIISDLTANKLFPINQRAITGPPKMSLLLEVESTSALIIESRLILVMHTDDLGGYITSNQQGKMGKSNQQGNPTTPDDGHSDHPQTGTSHAHPQPAQQPLMSVNSHMCGHLGQD